DKEVTISGWTLGGTSKDNYKLAETGNQTTAKADITARAITIKANDQRVEIGKSIATGTDKVSVTEGSLVRGHSITSVSLNSTSTEALENEGRISVSAAVIKKDAEDVTSNYKITYENGLMVVTNLKALITEDPVIAEGLVYTGVSQNLITSAGEAETSVEFSLNGTDYDDAVPAGTDAKTYTVYYRAKGDDSHEPGDAEELSVTIAKAPLTVSASANSITYGDAPADNGVTYTGFVNNETETVLKGTLAYEYTYQQYGNVGAYDITPKGLSANNYELTFAKGTLTVTKKAVTVSANAQTIAKDGKISTSLNQATAITPVGEDKLSAVTLTASINTAQTEGVIIPSGAKFSRGTDDVTANYDISYVNGKLKIKPAAVVTTAPAARSLSYNGTDQELVTAGTVSGGSIAYSLSENGTYSESIPTGKDAGTYTVYYKPVPDADHSEGEAGSVEVVIAKAAANVKADDKIKNVGKADPELTATVSGTYGEDSVEYILSRESGEAVGTYVITVSGNAVQGNYNVSYENGTFTISANSITTSVSLSQLTYTYDGTEKKPAVNVKTGETVLADTDYTVTYANNINAGTADVTVSEAEGGSYSFDPVTVHFTIEKAAITPSVSVNSWVYGEEASKPVVNGNAGNGAVTFTYKVKDAEDSTYGTEIPANMGSYTIKADIAETENYLSGSATADFEITMAEQGSSELKFIFEEGEPKPEYTGSAVTPKVLGYCGNELLTEGVDYSVKYSKNVNAGTAEAKISGKGDYNGEETLNFTIAPKKLSDESGAPAEGIVVTGLVVQGTGTVKPRLIYNGVVAASKEYEYKGSRTASGNEAVTITAKNVNFTGSIENLEVTRITDKNEFKKAEIKVKLNKVSRTYDGTPQLLSDELIVTNKEGTALVEDTDYIVSYPSDVINAGTVKVNIVGIGSHTGSVSKSYRIAPAKDAAISVSLVQEEGMAADTYSFVKTGVTPEVTASATVNGHTDILEEGKDYTVSYSSNKKAGAAAKVKLTMLGNYKGAKAVTKSFDIEKASLEDADVFLSDLIYKKAGTYKSKYVISVDGEILASTEYKVTYSDNGKVTLADNENEKTVTVTITSKDKNFKAGSITKTYRVYRNANATDVSKAAVKLVVKGGTKSHSSVGYTGAPIIFDPADDNRQADISVKIGKTTLYGAQVFEYFDVSYAENILKGKGTIILTAKDTENNPYSGMCSGKFTITAHKIK
ncbi:MAG: hypothetical protein IKI75_05970, partial [Lachnospiraceae bacterium]|nr:hypothetical protein [Lachnospiraceae bacterium]